MKKYLTVLGGTFIEYYDYTLYGFTAVYFAQNFFPPQDLDQGLLKAFIVFAVAYVAKPLGAFLFSHWGDHLGRRYPLKWTMLGIAIPTLIIGLLPTFDQWGWLATLALIMCRFLQGFLLASEYDGAALFIQENIPKKFASFGNSLLGLSYSLGILCASLVTSWSQIYFTSDIAWRIPFIIGGIAGFLMLYARSTILETPDYEKSNDQALGFLDLLKTHSHAIFSSALICGASGAIYQFTIIFWPTFLRDSLGVWDSASLYQVSLVLVFYTFTKPFLGLLADKIGPEKFLKMGAFIFGATVLALIFQVYAGQYYLLMYYILVITIPIYGLTGHVVLVKYISVKERYRCINIGHSLGSMIFSGVAPAIAMWIWIMTERPEYLLYYLISFTPFTLVGLYLLQYSYKKKQSRILSRV